MRTSWEEFRITSPLIFIKKLQDSLKNLPSNYSSFLKVCWLEQNSDLLTKSDKSVHDYYI